MNAVGSVLGETDDRELAESAVVYLHSVNGSGVDLLPHSRAEALLAQVTASPAWPVTGDLDRGFSWPVLGAVPRRSNSIMPLAAPTWPDSPYATPVTIELWWPADASGYRKVRRFRGLFCDPYRAYLAACCLWATHETGYGAIAAYLYGPDHRTVYRINEFAKTCSAIPEGFVAGIAATAADRDTTDPLPDSPWPVAAVPEEERVP